MADHFDMLFRPKIFLRAFLVFLAHMLAMFAAMMVLSFVFRSETIGFVIAVLLGLNWLRINYRILANKPTWITRPIDRGDDGRPR